MLLIYDPPYLSQLLEILLELNCSDHIPDHKKFNLGLEFWEAHDLWGPSPNGTSSDEDVPPYIPATQVHRSMPSQPEFSTLERETVYSSFDPKLLDTHGDPHEPPADLDSFVTEFVEEKLFGQNQRLVDKTSALLPYCETRFQRPIGKAQFERQAARERRERYSAENPHSVPNWLRRNQSLMIDPDGPNGHSLGERGGPPKREPVAASTAADDNDGDYRPKGGSSSKKRVRNEQSQSSTPKTHGKSAG